MMKMIFGTSGLGLGVEVEEDDILFLCLKILAVVK